MKTKLQCVYKGHAELAEGPVWHEDALWWVNITAGTLNRLDIHSGLNTSRGIGEYIGCAVPSPDSPGEWWIAGHNRILSLDWESGKISTLHRFPEHPASIRFNDGKLDSRGRFWFGTLSLTGEEQKACLFHRSLAGEINRTVDGITLSNGIAWNKDETQMFHIDTPTRSISLFPYDSETGSLGKRQSLATFQKDEGWPDGMCAGMDNDLWVAMWGGKQVLRVSMTDGTILDRIFLPVEQPTSTCLIQNPDGRSSLAITSAWQDLKRSPVEGPTQNGSIYIMRLN